MSERIEIPEGRVVREIEDAEGRALDFLMYGSVFLRLPEFRMPEETR